MCFRSILRGISFLLLFLVPGIVFYVNSLVIAESTYTGGGYSAMEGIPEQDPSKSEYVSSLVLMAPILIIISEVFVFYLFPWNIPAAVYTIGILVLLVWRSSRHPKLPPVARCGKCDAILVDDHCPICQNIGPLNYDNTKE